MATLQPPANLNQLPPELLLEIASYLSTSSKIALRLVNRTFFQTTPAPPRNWFPTASDCEKLAASRTHHERQELESGRRKCVHCGLLAPLRRFDHDAPLCKWHQARLMSASGVPAPMESSLKLRLLLLARETTGDDPVWVRVQRTYCVHEREVNGWHVSACRCECDSCGHFPVQCLVRLGGGNGTGGGGGGGSRGGARTAHTLQLSEPTGDGSYVREEHWVPAAQSHWSATIYPREIRGEALVEYRKLVPILVL